MPGRPDSYNLWRRVHVTLACAVFPSATFLAGCGSWLLGGMYDARLLLVVIGLLVIPVCIIAYYATCAFLTPVPRRIARAAAALAALGIMAGIASQIIRRSNFGFGLTSTPMEELVVLAIGLLALAWSLTPFPVTRRRRGHDVCDHCGYSLKGLHKPMTCPECGSVV